MELDTIFIPNRSFSVYVGTSNIEKKFKIPIYGNKYILKAEERKRQYELLEASNIRMPKQFTPETIDRLAIVKVQQKNNPLERAFFYVNSPEDFEKKWEELLSAGVVENKFVIEEFILGPRFNANFQCYGLRDIFGKLDFCGFEDRIQVNIQGFLNLPARDQLKINVPLKNEEVGHKGVTMRESKKPLVYAAAEKFIDAVPKFYPPRMIGLFSLQGAINEHSEFVVFDISPRIPGCPCVGPTSPEMRRLSLKFGRNIFSPIDLCMMEIKFAASHDRIDEIVT